MLVYSRFKITLLWIQGPRGKLSQDLVALWADEYGPALALLRRILPGGLIRYLNLPRPVVNLAAPPPPPQQALPGFILPQQTADPAQVRFFYGDESSLNWGSLSLALKGQCGGLLDQK